MPRLLLSDELWSKLEKILLQESIYNKRDLRMTVERMLYRMRVGYAWRDLPEAFGCWNSIYKRLIVWSAGAKWLRVSRCRETSQILSGSSLMVVTSKPISTARGLPAVKMRPSAKAERAKRPRSIWR